MFRPTFCILVADNWSKCIGRSYRATSNCGQHLSSTDSTRIYRNFDCPNSCAVRSVHIYLFVCMENCAFHNQFLQNLYGTPTSWPHLPIIVNIIQEVPSIRGVGGSLHPQFTVMRHVYSTFCIYIG